LLDLAFLVDVTSLLNYLNLKLQGKEKLFPSLVNDVSAFNTKLKLLIFQLEKRIWANCQIWKNKVNVLKIFQICKIHWKNQITSRGLW